MTLPRSLKWIGGVLLTLIALIVLVAATFDWNWMRDPIARRVSSSIDRTFAINGDLNVHLSLRPRIVANDIVIGNAAWSSEPSMARIKRLDFTIDILKLLAGSVVFPEIALSEPYVAFEVNTDGAPNWTTNEQDKNKPFQFPTVGTLSIDRGSATYRDPKIKTDLTLDIKTLVDVKDSPEGILDIAGKGRFKGLQASFTARGGALLSLRNADRPYPIKASAVIGTTKASIDGMLLDPLHLKGQKLNFTIEGSDLALLFPIIGVPIPPTPAYKLAGFLNHNDDLWTFDKLKGIVGHSDLAGEFAVDRAKHPQMITANLVSKNLDLKDLGGFIGAERGTKPSEIPPPSDRVLPREPFSLEKLKAANADVHFRGEKIHTGNMPIDNLRAHLIVDDGTLKLTPLDFGVAGGNLVSQIEMDGRNSRIVTHADITAKGLHLDRMFPTFKLADANTGTMGGRAKLDANGNSIAQMLASANGEAALIMDGGSVSELMLRLSNLDLANSLGVLLGGDNQVPILCMVSNFKAVDGDFIVKTLLLDTPKVSITGSGDVNFTDESLHLRLESQDKGFSLASLRGPFTIGGSFKTPLVRPELGGPLVRVGLAVALGAVTAGIGALIPLLDFGEDKESHCAALMRQAKSDTNTKASDMKPVIGK